MKINAHKETNQGDTNLSQPRALEHPPTTRLVRREFEPRWRLGSSGGTPLRCVQTRLSSGCRDFPMKSLEAGDKLHSLELNLNPIKQLHN